MRFIFFLLSGIFVALATSTHILKYESIFNFGDSLSDTGNYVLSNVSTPPLFDKLPYGKTFFRRATGRCSDGRLVIDFIAEACGLPYTRPFLKLRQGDNSKYGANFAVAGATALDPKFFYDRKMESLLWTNLSLSVQLDDFKRLKPSLCSTTEDCKAYFKKSLFFMGEIGGNDYNYAFFIGWNMKQLEAMVPLVVQTITNAAATLIEEGAVDMIVPGNLPIGCSALYLTQFGDANKSDTDPKTGCLRKFNKFARYHDNLLKRGLDRLRIKYPHANLIYADYYGAAMRFYNAPLKYGFSKGALKACCGGNGPYNFNFLAPCGHENSKTCTDPSLYASWDAIHLTEAAYRIIADGIIKGNFTTPPLSGFIKRPPHV